MNILFLTTIIMSKNCNGGEVASQCFVDAIKALGHGVTVVGYLRKGDKFVHDKKETIVVDERYTETNKSKLFAFQWLLLSLWKGLPYSTAKYFSYTYIRLIRTLVSNYKYDLVVIDHAQLAWIHKFFPKRTKIVMIAHNVEHVMYEELSRKASNPLSKLLYQREANLIRRQEEYLSVSAEQVWTLTDYDNKYFSQLTGISRTKTFGIAPSSTQPQNKLVSKSFDIGILGSWSWKANIEALEWFIQNVYPYLPINLSIHVAGKGADWLRDKYPNIYYRGVVPDAQEFMAQAKVVVIPTQSGGGIQIKTLDAIASGSQIVATPVALRGISQPPSTVKLATHPKEFADLIVSAIYSEDAETAIEEAKKWYYTRKKQFCSLIASAIDELLVMQNCIRSHK